MCVLSAFTDAFWRIWTLANRKSLGRFKIYLNFSSTLPSFLSSVLEGSTSFYSTLAFSFSVWLFQVHCPTCFTRDLFRFDVNHVGCFPSQTEIRFCSNPWWVWVVQLLLVLWLGAPFHVESLLSGGWPFLLDLGHPVDSFVLLICRVDRFPYQASGLFQMLVLQATLELRVQVNFVAPDVGCSPLSWASFWTSQLFLDF